MDKPQQPSNGRSKRRRKRAGGSGIFPEHPGVPGGWVNIADAPDQISAGMLESALKAEGIPVILNRPPVFAYLGIGGVHGVMVPEERADEAREILNDIWDMPE